MIDVDTIVRSVQPAVSALGLELYDVELSGSGRARVLRVLVNRCQSTMPRSTSAWRVPGSQRRVPSSLQTCGY